MQSQQMLMVFVIGFVLGGVFHSHVLGSCLDSLMLLCDENDKMFRNMLGLMDEAVKAKEKYEKSTS